MTPTLAMVLAASLSAAPPALIHRTAKGHPMQYDVARPAGWTAGAHYPVLVVIPDATRRFRANLEAFVAARKDAPWLVVAPYVLTSGGARAPHDAWPYTEAVWKEVARTSAFAFDEAGIAAVLREVKEEDGGGDAFLTGWEAGGHTVWALLFRHAEWFRAVVPVSPNYAARWQDTWGRPARPPARVKVLFCGPLEGDQEKSRQAGLTQTRRAIADARAHGFGEVPLETLPHRAHGPLAEDVFAFLKTLVH